MPRPLPAKSSGNGNYARQCLQPCAQALITQMAQTALCNRHYPAIPDRPLPHRTAR